MQTQSADADSVSTEIEEKRRIEALALLDELDSVLTRLDALGLGVAANHISRGLEMAREHVNIIQSGFSSPT